MLTILLFLLILAILILVHELGHFMVAKLFGIRVDEFGLGFPPKLFSKKIGETIYTLNAIPFGGFVKIFGEDPVAEQAGYGASLHDDKNRSFQYKPKWIQALVLCAGVAMNILFGYLLISLGFMIGLPAPVGASPYGEVKSTELVITSVLPNSPADKIGLISGDIIISASASKNSVQNLSPETVSDLIAKSQSPIILTYKRGNILPQTVTITPSNNIVLDKQAIGISMDMIGILKLPLGPALLQGLQTTGQILRSIVVSLWYFFTDITNFKSNISQVSGPVGIARIVGQASSIGFVYVLSLVALISLNLAVINLIPFPALDGGRLFFILIEVIINRKINPKVASWVNGLGFAILLTLMVVVSLHDIWGVL